VILHMIGKNPSKILLLFSMLMVACADSSNREAPIPKGRGPAPRAEYPGPPLPRAQTARVREADAFDDLFTMARVVRLEVTESSVIGYLRQIRMIGDRLVVLDDIQKAVLLFDDEGSFLARIGRQGEGPGEYIDPVNIHLHNSQIAVVDQGGNQLLFYEMDGTHSKTIAPDTSAFPIFLYGNLVLEDDLIYVCDFHSLNKTMPKHLALTFSDPARPVFGFGDRLPFFHTGIGKKMPYLNTPVFEKVNGTICTIPMYQTAIDVFDLEGHALGTLPSGIDGITPEIVSEIKNINDFNEALALAGAAFLFHHRHLVFVMFHSPFVVNAYDVNGNLIRRMPLKTPATKNARFMENGFLIGIMNLTTTPSEATKKALGDALYTAFTEAGYDPEEYENDNPYLILFRADW